MFAMNPRFFTFQQGDFQHTINLAQMVSASLLLESRGYSSSMVPFEYRITMSDKAVFKITSKEDMGRLAEELNR